MSSTTKIKSREELKPVVQAHQQEGKKVVQCHGCFDIIHPGHIRYFEQARKMGDILVVSLTSDKYILKGDERPYMPEELRVKSMASLELVDYVYLDDESWAGPMLDYVRPDIYVKGKEYENVYTGVFGDERKIVENYGGKMYFTSGDVVFSSSQLIDNFKEKFSLDYEVYSIYCQRNGVTLDRLTEIIDQFPTKKVAVVGEAIVDEFHFSEVIDVSGEAPILTIRPLEQAKYAGAAAVVAKHLASMGGQSYLYSCAGRDELATFLSDNLDQHGVHCEFLRKDMPTIRKVRFLGDNQKLLKVDYSKNIILEPDEEHQIIEKIKAEHQDADCLIFSDFVYGLITDNIRKEITKWCNENSIKVLADVSSTLGGNIAKYKDVFLITPTEKEARMVLDDKESGLSHVASRLLEKTNSKNIIITLGANGLLAFKNKQFKIYGKEEEHLEQEYIPAMEKKANDPMGAGDAMLAMIALSVASGASLAEAVYLGSVASCLEVNKVGNMAIEREEVLNFLHQRPELVNVSQV